MTTTTARHDLEEWALGVTGTGSPQFRALATRLVGGDLGEIRLLRRGTNLVLASEARHLVFRLQYADVAAGTEENLRITTELANVGAPIVPPVTEECARTVDVTLTAWPQGTPAPEGSENALGMTLHDLHSMRSLDGLPPVEVSSRFDARLGNLDPAVPKWIAQALESHALRAVERLAEFDSTIGFLLHGDAHVGNLVRWKDRWALIDLDDLCRGPREFDLAPSFVSYRRFHRDTQRWNSLQDSYGSADWAAVEYLSVVREATMNSWLAGLWSHSEAAQAELVHRVRTWDENSMDHEPWKAR